MEMSIISVPRGLINVVGVLNKEHFEKVLHMLWR